MNPDKMGNFIKQIRQENNLTQKELADKLGVTYQAVSKWENGKNAPDIAILKKISDEYHVNIDEILSGEKRKKKKTMGEYLASIIPVLFIVLAIVLVNFANQRREVEMTTISSKCSDFKLTGVAAYNKEKTAINISKIEFCGKEDDQEYQRITCKLYERENKTSHEISSCEVKKNVKLEEYLKDLSIQVDNYSTMCKKMTSNTLFLEIVAINTDNVVTTYTIPIQLNDKC